MQIICSPVYAVREYGLGRQSFAPVFPATVSLVSVGQWSVVRYGRVK